MRLSNISIHALLAESDAYKTAGLSANEYNFYPRSPCGERRRNTPDDFCSRGISIHALLAESDSGVKVFRRGNDLFLSTLSLRRATK